MKIIEVKPYRSGWDLFEPPGVEPFFVGPESQLTTLTTTSIV